MRGHDPDAVRHRAWCYLRNVVHAVYREARHVGPPGDAGARLHVSGDHALAAAATRCSANRQLLKRSSLFKRTSAAKSVDEVLRPYQETTGLALSDLVLVFSEPGWATRYGGLKWAGIGRLAVELANALSDGKLDAADVICNRILRSRHNSGPLVPSVQEWRATPYLREKWPELCD
jgi:hypothetical protein